MTGNMDSDKEEFLREFGDDYGYPNAPKSIDEIRATEFRRLDHDGLVYLDHAGTTLYSETQMEAIFKGLTTSVFGNPHSQSDSSLATAEIIRETRQQVLDFCNASARDYKCIFTSGATAALKLVGEAFPWSSQSTFMYTMENHNSVLGIREYALSKGATSFAIDIEEAAHEGGGCKSPVSSIKVLQRPTLRRNEATLLEEEPSGNAYNLFAFPSECNFSGSRFSLHLVNTVKDDTARVLEGSPYCKGRWMVLIDAAKGCATKPPDLSKYQADFVIISFYKIFGYPTGLGALVVRTEAAKLLKKSYFSGGTVAASIADIDFVKRREGIEEFFEDGTISFLSIASLHQGFKILNTLSMSAISRHTSSLATYARKILSTLRHGNGGYVCTLYGRHESEVLYDELGPVVSFNLKRPDGSWFGYREVEKLASLSGIQLRTGCFCNPGACAKYLGLSHSDLLSNIKAGHVCWDDHDIVNGKPTGAVRVSFGYMSTFEDAKKLVNFIVSSFASWPTQAECVYLSRARSICFPDEGLKRSTAKYFLRSVTVYPIKSCAGFRVDSWPLSSTGLLHDREWLLKSLSGEILTQKKVPEMCLISTYIDLNLGILFVESPHCKMKLQIRLRTDFSTAGGDELDLYSQRYEVRGYDNEVSIWFSNAVGRPCTLLRCSGSKNSFCPERGNTKGMCRDVETKLNFVNGAQLLLISEESVSDLNNRLSSNVQEGLEGPPIQVNPMRFRPNLVVSGGAPYAEDEWRSLKIGNQNFVSLGGCNRCQMINLNPQEGEVRRSREPLATLASYRRVQGTILFGVLLRYDNRDDVGQDMDSWLEVGQEVHPNTD
ncbi:molybdenum cofactor sulfurase isoform X1 [Rhododendron vialii]|uniref:molybdenum cofactor sulfurase isoform X1 n=3 Tax=Rhododendron vialii TaxID=182163 RepID=UPI00265FB3EC|nr:molybdenum cofactor sulfurase isoform X1 [Rhododendron vialii]